MKAAFIIPYFGTFNSYFQLFLSSIKDKKQFEFLIFTDDKTDYDYPDNVRYYSYTLKEFTHLFNKKLGTELIIERPYKLCDFRPMYGLVFEDYLEGFDYWGYCDTDLIFGDLDGICGPLLNEDYDKLFFLGHCTLIKNTKENNNLFRATEEDRRISDGVIANPRNVSFDEEFTSSINTIFSNHQKKCYFEELQANAYTKSSGFRLTKWDKVSERYQVSPVINGFFVFDKGHVFSYEKIKHQIVKKEFLYLHLQSRPMLNRVSSETSCYKIIPNVFEPLEVDKVTDENFSKIRQRYLNFHYVKLRWKNLKVKLRRKVDKQFYG